MPAAPIHGKHLAFFFASYDVSTWFNDIDASRVYDMADATTFQPAGDVKVWAQGLRQGSLTAAGVWDATAITGIDAILAGVEAAAENNQPILVFPDQGLVSGAACWLCAAAMTKFEIKSPIAGVVAINVEAMANGEAAPLLSGRGQAYVDFAASGNTTVIDNLADGPTNGGGAACVFIDGTGRDAGTIQVQLEQSPDGTTWAVIGTVNCAAGAVAALPFLYAITMRRYVRCVVTVTGGTTGNYDVSFGVARD